MSSWITLWLLFIAAACTTVEDDERQGAPTQLPDANDIETLKILQCSACRSTEFVIKSLLVDSLEETRHHSQPDETSLKNLVAASVLGTCEHEQLHVGLLRQPSSVTVSSEFRHEFLNDFRGDIVKAGWISELWAEECGDVMQRMQPHFLDFTLRKEVLDWCPVCSSVTASFAAAASSRPAPYSRSMASDEL
mmetsp:Transcript_23327/g.27041  ORF Transcript_23327/g.27041 Transcript_23327/m.27041 type:complete len:192 (-) Transcript_23327:26-601(-)